MIKHSDERVRSMVDRLVDTDVPVQDRREMLAALRSGTAGVSSQLDAELLAHCDRQTLAVGALRSTLDKLEALTDRLTQPPIYEATFLGLETVSNGQTLARVSSGSGGADTLVHIVDDALRAMLTFGDRVLLTAERNAILSRCPDSSIRPGGECVRVVRKLDAGRLVIRLHDREVVVRIVASLASHSFDSGDTVRLDPTGLLAVEYMAADQPNPYDASAYATSLPPEAFAGSDELRDAILRRFATARAHPELAARYGIADRQPWIILDGPPGNGKTTLARVIGGLLQRTTGRTCRVRKVNASELASPYVGETEERIRTLVRELGRSDDDAMLFIDEVEAIARSRGTAGNIHGDRFLSAWLSELEGFEGRPKIILVAATNRADLLDPAFRSRFQLEIRLPRPAMEAARAIFLTHLGASFPYAPGGSETEHTRHAMIDAALAKLYLPGVAGATAATLRLRDGKSRVVDVRELVSGRLIEQICVEARARAFQREADGDRPGVCADDLDAAVEAARDRLRTLLTPQNAHSHLDDLPLDASVVGVDSAPRSPARVTFLHRAAR